MNKTVALLLGLALLAGADAVFARGAGSGGGHGAGGGGHGTGGGGHGAGGGHAAPPGGHGGHPGGMTGGPHPGVGVPPGHFVGRPPVGVRPPVGHPPFHRTVVVGGAIVVGAYYPYYPYYPYPYYPPMYAPPPAYIEQGTGPYYYCPDYGDYYPRVATCPSQWMQVYPAQGGYPN